MAQNNKQDYFYKRNVNLINSNPSLKAVVNSMVKNPAISKKEAINTVAKKHHYTVMKATNKAIREAKFKAGYKSFVKQFDNVINYQVETLHRTERPYAYQNNLKGLHYLLMKSYVNMLRQQNKKTQAKNSKSKNHHINFDKIVQKYHLHEPNDETKQVIAKTLLDYQNKSYVMQKKAEQEQFKEQKENQQRKAKLAQLAKTNQNIQTKLDKSKQTELHNTLAKAKQELSNPMSKTLVKAHTVDYTVVKLWHNRQLSNLLRPSFYTKYGKISEKITDGKRKALQSVFKSNRYNIDKVQRKGLKQILNDYQTINTHHMILHKGKQVTPEVLTHRMVKRYGYAPRTAKNALAWINKLGDIQKTQKLHQYDKHVVSYMLRRNDKYQLPNYKFCTLSLHNYHLMKHGYDLNHRSFGVKDFIHNLTQHYDNFSSKEVSHEASVINKVRRFKNIHNTPQAQSVINKTKLGDAPKPKTKVNNHTTHMFTPHQATNGKQKPNNVQYQPKHQMSNQQMMKLAMKQNEGITR